MSDMGGASPYYPWDNKRIQDPDSPSDGFAVVHPDRGAESIDYVMITHGLNADFTALPESQWKRCRKCGFPGINTARSPKGWGTGIVETNSNSVDNGGWGNGQWDAGLQITGGPGMATSGVAYYTNVAANSGPVVTSGCPFCGTYIYD